MTVYNYLAQNMIEQINHKKRRLHRFQHEPANSFFKIPNLKIIWFVHKNKMEIHKIDYSMLNGKYLQARKSWPGQTKIP